MRARDKIATEREEYEICGCCTWPLLYFWNMLFKLPASLLTPARAEGDGSRCMVTNKHFDWYFWIGSQLNECWVYILSLDKCSNLILLCFLCIRLLLNVSSPSVLSWPLISARGGNDFIRMDIVAAEVITEEWLSRKSQRLRYFSLP